MLAAINLMRKIRRPLDVTLSDLIPSSAASAVVLARDVGRTADRADTGPVHRRDSPKVARIPSAARISRTPRCSTCATALARTDARRL